MVDHAQEPVVPIQIESPDIERLDSKNFNLSYDEPVDTMFIYFIDGDIEPVSALVDPEHDIYALVDAVSQEVVGLQLEAFLARVVYEWPEFLTLAIWAGISSDRLAPVIQEITGRTTSCEGQRDVQRRFFDLSVKKQIEQFFRAPRDRSITATV